MSAGALPVLLLPHPPLLHPGLAGAGDVLAGLREACLAELRGLVGRDPARLVVVGPAEETRAWPAGTPVDVRRFGGAGPRTPGGLPQSLGVGRALLDGAGWAGDTVLHGIAGDAAEADVAALARTARELAAGGAVVLLGELSACRDEKGPGSLDERAFPLDDALARALADGDAAALRELDAGLAREVMVGGRDVLRLLGHLAPDGPLAAGVRHRSAPFGVTYLIALWELPEQADRGPSGPIS